MFKNRFYYVTGLVFLGLLSILYDERTTFFLLVTVAVFPIISGIMMRITAGNLILSMEMDRSSIFKEEESMAVLTIKNRSIFPISLMEVTVDYENSLVGEWKQKTFSISLMGNSTQEISIGLSSDYVGDIVFCISRMSCFDVTRCFRYEQRSKQGKSRIGTNVLILPNEYLMQELFQTGGQAMYDNEVSYLPKAGSDPSDILSIREYIEGDKLHQIHWKLSAKCNQLMMKEYCSPAYYCPLIIIDLCTIKSNVELLDTLFESFQCMVAWHLTQNQRVEVCFYNIETKNIETMKIIEEQEAAALYQVLYHQVSKTEDPYVIEALYASKQEMHYTNVIYFGLDYEKVITQIERIESHTPIYCVIVQNEGETAQETVVLTEQSAIRYVRRSHGRDDIGYMMDDYQRGGRWNGNL